MLQDIQEILKSLGINDYELYGKYAAKIGISNCNAGKRHGKLILMTAMTPTPAGEGKTTTAIGLAQALKKLGKNAGIAIREPSLGPCFGVKGGQQVVANPQWSLQIKLTLYLQGIFLQFLLHIIYFLQ